VSAAVAGGGALMTWGAVTGCVAAFPLGVWQTVAAHHALDGAALVVLAVASTALAGTLFVHGRRFIGVQHSSVVGSAEPVRAPLEAFVFQARWPFVGRLAGGVPIPVADVPFVRFGQAGVEPVA
jgi:hypothetical protein